MAAEAPYLGQNCTTPWPRGHVLLRWVWSFVQATVFRWSPRPFHGFRAGLLRLFGATIPEPFKVVIFPTAKITFPWQLTLEPRSMVGPRVTLYNLAPIILRRGANISQNCPLCAGTHDFNRWDMPLVTRPIRQRRECMARRRRFCWPRRDRGRTLRRRRPFRGHEGFAAAHDLRGPALPAGQAAPRAAGGMKPWLSSFGFARPRLPFALRAAGAFHPDRRLCR